MQKAFPADDEGVRSHFFARYRHVRADVYSGRQCRHLLNASCLSSFAQYYGFLKISAFSSSLPTWRALAVQVLAAL